MQQKYVPEFVIEVMAAMAKDQSLYEIYRECFANHTILVDVPPCDRWLQFLDETVQTPEVIAQVQEFFGYCLTPSTAYEKCLICFGPGASGKSTLLKVLHALVGPKNCAAVNIEDLGDAFQRATLYGKLLNISTEIGSKAMESQIFKAIVSGDTIQAAFKHENSFVFDPTCKMVIVTNSPPRFADEAAGSYRRILLVPFTKQFLESGDKGLVDQLKGEIPGIFHWALAGLKRLWQQKDFTQCDETNRIMLDDPLCRNSWRSFVKDECETGDESYEVLRKDLYNHYEAYCTENGYRKFSMGSFFYDLKSSNQNIRECRRMIHGRHIRVLTGIRIFDKTAECAR